MTLIATQVSQYGIVLATDSNLTDSAYRFARQSRKNFELPHQRGGLSVAGCWSVDGVPMDEWMPRFIARPETFAGGSLAAFAGHLRMALESEMLPAEKRLGSMIHIAGYAREGDGFHPEFYFVRNFEKSEDDGRYSGISDTFASDEHFWKGPIPKSGRSWYLWQPEKAGFSEKSDCIALYSGCESYHDLLDTACLF